MFSVFSEPINVYRMFSSGIMGSAVCPERLQITHSDVFALFQVESVFTLFPLYPFQHRFPC